MSSHPNHHDDDLAQRTTSLLAHLDAALSEETIAAMTGVWATLERAATSSDAHARAVRSRMFWDTLRPGGAGEAPFAPQLAFTDAELQLEPATAAARPVDEHADGVSDLVAEWADDDLVPEELPPRRVFGPLREHEAA